MTKKRLLTFPLLLLLTLLLHLSAPAALPGVTAGDSASVQEKDPASCLLRGKNSLDRGEYKSAVILLTSAYEKLPLLGDYALSWRALAYEKSGDLPSALADLRTIREKYGDSCLVKNVRTREIELSLKNNDPAAGDLLESFLRDYPSNMEMKYAYALYLKAGNKAQKAKELFREIYQSASPQSAKALGELSPADITTEDLLKRGNNLNSAWMFEEAEKAFRTAMQKDTGRQLRSDSAAGLAYCVFRQKRYKEAADLYRQAGDRYWRVRSLFRAGDWDAFHSEIIELSRSDDKRVASVLLAYGMKKRRDGDTTGALKIFNEVLSRYPSAHEEALWNIGWTQYLSRDYAAAAKIFSQLVSLSGDSRYVYWNNRCRQMQGDPETVKLTLSRKNGQDFYAFLSLIRGNQKPPALDKSPQKATALKSSVTERVEILSRLGFKQEASSELLHAARRNPTPGELAAISAWLVKLGNYRSSIALISKLPYAEELHDLFYPLGFWPEVEEAARARGIDPLLVLSVMREESRFAADARSIAGALGLMQLMPQTAHKISKSARVDLKNSSDLYNARTNIFIGSHYLKHLLNRLGSIPLALAAYNGGEDAVKDWTKKGNYRTVDEFIEDIPYEETRNYVKKVMTSYFEYMRSRPDTDITQARTNLGNL
jgi:soluble lytic murein transglycosylase